MIVTFPMLNAEKEGAAFVIPVVISSRINDGVITMESLLCGNTVSSNNLSPQKAAILLRLALTTGDASQERLEEM